MIQDKNLKFAFITSLGVGMSTFLFLFSMLIDKPMFSYFICLILSLFYLSMTVTHDLLTDKQNRLFSKLTMVFAIIYCTLICIVYYTQITFVRLGNPSQEALSIVSYTPPNTAFFALDILGYTFLSISTLFLAFTIENDKPLKVLLIVHGIIGISGFAVPLLPFLYEASGQSSDMMGTLVLVGWCILFIPICVLLARYYYSKKKEALNNI